MEFIRNFPLFAIVLSLFSGVLCTSLPAKAARNYTLSFEGVLIAMMGAVLTYTIRTGETVTYVMGEFPAPWGNEIRFGVLESLMALSFMIILLSSVLGGWRFLVIDTVSSKINLYFALINLLTAALLALVFTNDIFTGYVFLEIMTLTSCGILIIRQIGRTTVAAIRYMILNLLGSGLYLLGTTLLYDLTGNLLMEDMQITMKELASDPGMIRVLAISVTILTIGLSIKSGLFPFHYWMPDTYGRATPSSAAILSSLVSKAYIFLLIKIYCRVVSPEVLEKLHVSRILMVLGMLGIIFGSVAAIRADHINRMVAFSSAAQIGYIYMGIGLGGPVGFTAAIYHILAHAVTKSLLFLTTPRLAEVSGGQLLFKNLTGSGFRRKDAGVFFTVASLSMIGIPVFAGFPSKLYFAWAGQETGRYFLPVMIVLAVSTVLNVMYFVRTLVRIYSRPKEILWKEEKKPAKGPEVAYLFSGMVLSLANLFLGLYSQPIIDLIRQGLSTFG